MPESISDQAALLPKIVLGNILFSWVCRFNVRQAVLEMMVVVALTILYEQYSVGDIIVVWRAWVLWPSHRPIQVVLSLCTIISFGRCSHLE